MPTVPEDEIFAQVFLDTEKFANVISDKRKTEFGVFDDNDEPIELFEPIKIKTQENLKFFVDIIAEFGYGHFVVVYSYFADDKNTRRDSKSYLNGVYLKQVAREIDSTIDLAVEWGYNIYMSAVLETFLEENLQ